MKERRKLLIEQCDLIIMFEGGGGTADESSIALNLNIPVYCFPITGGASNGMFYDDNSFGKIIKCTLDNYQTILPQQIFK